MSFSTRAAWVQSRLRYSGFFFGRRCVPLLKGRPIISFTFDDFPRSALLTGGAILEEHGTRGTYYAALGLMNTVGPVGPIFSEEDLHEVLDRGHELGCHTFDHCHSWSTPPGAFEKSVLKNKRTLNQLLPGASFPTLSYPLGIPRPRTKKVVGNHFLACRGSSQTFNFRTVDLNFLRAFFIEQRRSDTSIKTVIDRTCQLGGWLIFATHDVSDNPSRFGCTPKFFKDIVRCVADSGATILPVAAALAKLHVPARNDRADVLETSHKLEPRRVGQ